MAFIMPGDADYECAKQAKRGERRINDSFDGFLEWFDKRYGFPPLWLSTDHFMQAPHIGAATRIAQPRLSVTLERSWQYMQFREEKGGNFARDRQRETLAAFQRIVPMTTLVKPFGLDDDANWRDALDQRLFVTFDDFEQVTKAEIHGSLSPGELSTLEEQLGLGDQFWRFNSFAGQPILFVRTATLAVELSATDLPDRWADAYVTLAKAHDEFGYLTRGDIRPLKVDSKENFDQGFQSNWYYYFR
jgi:hypothetical protein